MRLRLSRLPGCMGERGQGVIELALALPVFLAVIGAVIDGGWAFHQAGMVSVAAQAAQRAVGIIDTGAGHCAGAPPSVYTDLALSAARVAAPTLDPGRMALGLQYLEPGCSGRMRTLAVSVGYPIKALTPWFAPLLSGLRLTARAATAVEELAPPWWGQAGEVQAQQAQLASLTTAYGQATAELHTQQAQLASVTAAYGQAAAEVQTQRTQLASLTAAYQAEVAQAASLSNAASQYYSDWQNASATASALSQAAGYYYSRWQVLEGAGASQREGSGGGDH